MLIYIILFLFYYVLKQTGGVTVNYRGKRNPDVGVVQVEQDVYRSLTAHGRREAIAGEDAIVGVLHAMEAVMSCIQQMMKQVYLTQS